MQDTYGYVRAERKKEVIYGAPSSTLWVPFQYDTQHATATLHCGTSKYSASTPALQGVKGKFIPGEKFHISSYLAKSSTNTQRFFARCEVREKMARTRRLHLLGPAGLSRTTCAPILIP